VLLVCDEEIGAARQGGPSVKRQAGAKEAEVADAIAEDHLLHDASGLDGFAACEGVGDKKFGARRLDGEYEQVELILFDLDAAVEGCAEDAEIGIADDAPADAIQKGLQHLAQEARGVEFEFPDDLELFAEVVVSDAAEGAEAVGKRCCGDVGALDGDSDGAAAEGDDELPAPPGCLVVLAAAAVEVDTAG